MEALANYSALLMLERIRGPDALQDVLDRFRSNLLEKNENGQTLESAGPISWGPRLDSSQARAWRTITYEKGSWIIHMLRRQMGDEPFLTMLGELCRRYRFRSVSVEDFRLLAAEFLRSGAPDPKLENFYDNWVNDVGVPRFKLTHVVKGKSPSVRVQATVTQSEVAKDFGVCVPLELRFSSAKPIVRWIHTSNEPVSVELTVPRKPSELVLNPAHSVLAAER
jgi:aminopeptidase N